MSREVKKSSRFAERLQVLQHGNESFEKDQKIPRMREGLHKILQLHNPRELSSVCGRLDLLVQQKPDNSIDQILSFIDEHKSIVDAELKIQLVLQATWEGPLFEYLRCTGLPISNEFHNPKETLMDIWRNSGLVGSNDADQFVPHFIKREVKKRYEWVQSNDIRERLDKLRLAQEKSKVAERDVIDEHDYTKILHYFKSMSELRALETTVREYLISELEIIRSHEDSYNETIKILREQLKECEDQFKLVSRELNERATKAEATTEDFRSEARRLTASLGEVALAVLIATRHASASHADDDDGDEGHGSQGDRAAEEIGDSTTLLQNCFAAFADLSGCVTKYVNQVVNCRIQSERKIADLISDVDASGMALNDREALCMRMAEKEAAMHSILAERELAIKHDSDRVEVLQDAMAAATREGLCRGAEHAAELKTLKKTIDGYEERMATVCIALCTGAASKDAAVSTLCVSVLRTLALKTDAEIAALTRTKSDMLNRLINSGQDTSGKEASGKGGSRPSISPSNSKRMSKAGSRPSISPSNSVKRMSQPSSPQSSASGKSSSRKSIVDRTSDKIDPVSSSSLASSVGGRVGVGTATATGAAAGRKSNSSNSSKSSNAGASLRRASTAPMLRADVKRGSVTSQSGRHVSSAVAKMTRPKGSRLSAESAALGARVASPKDSGSLMGLFARSGSFEVLQGSDDMLDGGETSAQEQAGESGIEMRESQVPRLKSEPAALEAEAKTGGREVRWQLEPPVLFAEADTQCGEDGSSSQPPVVAAGEGKSGEHEIHLSPSSASSMSSAGPLGIISEMEDDAGSLVESEDSSILSASGLLTNIELPIT